MPCVGTGEILRRQQRRRQAVLRRAARMEALGHGAEHLAQSDRLRGGQAQRPDHLLFGEIQQLADRRRRAERTHGPGDVPADVVMRRIDGVADAAFHFRAEDQRVQEIARRRPGGIRQAPGWRTRPGRPDG